MKVVIVGNGAGLLNRQHGLEIDQADAVVRINYYRINGYAKHVGTRTDYWVNHLMNIEQDAGDYIPPGLTSVKEVWVFARRAKYNTSEELWEQIEHPGYKDALAGIHIRNISEEDYGELHREVHDHRPSNGYGAVALAVERLNPDELLLLGLDILLSGQKVDDDDHPYLYYWGDQCELNHMASSEQIPAERRPLYRRLAAHGYTEKWNGGDGCVLFTKTQARDSNGDD